MARPPSPDKRLRVELRLIDSTLAKLNLLSIDSFTLQLSYGERNHHVERALEDYFKKNYPERTQP